MTSTPQLRSPAGRALVTLSAVLAVALVVASWIGLPQSRPAPLVLMARGRDGRLGTDVVLGARGEAAGESDVDGARFPLLLAVRNEGTETVRPAVLELSIPARFVLLGGDGHPLSRKAMVGNPLARYAFDLGATTVTPTSLRGLGLPGDTLWIAWPQPSFDCAIDARGVPTFTPASGTGGPAMRIFYAIRGGAERRWTGLLGLRLEGGVRAPDAPAAPLPLYPVEVQAPEQSLPAMGALEFGGTRTLVCGDPEDPETLTTVLWSTASGGRFLVIYHEGAPRKYLFDLDRDSVVELEMWDGDGDGGFEARRRARFPVPAFLLPALPPAPTDSTATQDSARHDSA